MKIDQEKTSTTYLGSHSQCLKGWKRTFPYNRELVFQVLNKDKKDFQHGDARL